MTMKALALVALTGCATLFGGGPDNVPIASDPTGATIKVNGAFVGKTPMVLGLDRGSPAFIEISADGYAPKAFAIEKGINGWFWLNILWVELVVPVVVDLLDGDWHAFDDTPILVHLMPLGAT